MKIPLIASGCIGDARGRAAALALGADGINIRTRFCAAQEAPIHQKVKNFIVRNDERATNLIVRRIRNTASRRTSDEVIEISLCPDAVYEDIRPLVSCMRGRTALESGGIDAGLVRTGQVQGLIHDDPTCAKLLERIIGEASVPIRNRLTDWMSDNG